MAIFCMIHFRLNLRLLYQISKNSSELPSKSPFVFLSNLQFEKIAAEEHQPVKNSPDTADSAKILGWEVLEPDRTVKVKQMKSKEDVSGLVVSILGVFHKG